MSDTTIAVLILWVFLYMYSIVGSVDFGAGFWTLVYGNRKDTKAADIANRFLSPSWKVTNVFLVLFVVALLGFFPRAAFQLAALLLVPVSLVLLLLTIRSTFMVYAYSSDRYTTALRWVSGLTGLLIPGLLISVLPITIGGFIDYSGVENGAYPELLFSKLLQSPVMYAHIGFGISTGLFLSALFLADYAMEAEDKATYRTYRGIAIALGPLTLAMALLATFTMVPEAQWMVERMKQHGVWFVFSLVAFLFGYAMLWVKQSDGTLGKPRYAVLGIAVQYALASLGYFSSHMPYMIYPTLTVDQGITNPVMFRSLLIGYIVSTLVLVPVFVWFWKLFMQDKRYLKQE